jgi:transcriptional repressor NrdR
MKCPHCGAKDTKVVDSRPVEGGIAQRRRRSCPKCRFRFTTQERVEPIRLVVIKRDGHREPFSLAKVRAGLSKALTHRPAAEAPDAIDQAVAEVEAQIKGRGKPTIESSEIGKVVLSKLKQIDKVAYVRFASVHKKFDEPERFKEEVERLVENPREER